MRFPEAVGEPGEIRSPEEAQARATLESIGDAVITTDASGVVTYLNPVAERPTGGSAADALGRSLDAVLPLISEATREPVPNTAARCLAEGRSIDLEDGVLLLRRDGTEVPIGDSAAPVRDSDGQYRFECGGWVFEVGVSIGLILVTAESGGIAAVLRVADAACYAAKEGGGNRVHGGSGVTRPALRMRTPQSDRAAFEGTS